VPTSIKNYLVYEPVDGTPRHLRFVANIRAINIQVLKREMRRRGFRGTFYVVPRLRKIVIKR